METRDRLRLALYVFLVSLLLRVAWSGWADVVPVSDFRGYDWLAVRWLETGVLGVEGSYAYRTPGYPGFLALIYALFGHSWKVAGLVQAILGAVTSGLTTVVASYVLSARGTALAGLLHALSPTALAYVPILASENLAVFLLMLGLLFVAAAQRASPWRGSALALASGIVLGSLLLVRPAAVWYAPAWVVLTGYSAARRRLLPAGPLLAVAGTALVLAPWFVRNQRLDLGYATLSTAGGVNLWMANNELAVTGGYCREAQGLVPTDDLTEFEADRAYARAAYVWIRSNPGRYLSLCGTRLVRLLGVWPDTWAAWHLLRWPMTQDNPEAAHEDTAARAGSEQAPPLPANIRRYNQYLLAGVRAIVAPLVLLSLVLSFSRWRDYVVVVLPAGTYVFGLALTYVQIRFRVLADPLLFVPLAGLLSDVVFGTEELGNWLTRSQKKVLSVGLVLATLIVHATGLASGLYRLEP